MEASAALSFSSPKTHSLFNHHYSFSSKSKPICSSSQIFQHKLPKGLTFPPLTITSLSPTPFYAVAETSETTAESLFPLEGPLSRIDKSGRFCRARAAREFALLISYAACLEGSDPVFLFEKRINAKKVPGYVFDKGCLLQYDHKSFSGEPVQVESETEAKELIQKNEKDWAIEAEVLCAHPKLVYNKFAQRMARDLLREVVNRWNENVLVIDKITPKTWKDAPAARILELCILHLAMAEISSVGTAYKIVINEAVDLAKRFCDGSAPRIINGCLRTYVEEHCKIVTA